VGAVIVLKQTCTTNILRPTAMHDVVRHGNVHARAAWKKMTRNFRKVTNATEAYCEMVEVLIVYLLRFIVSRYSIYMF
jgi:hypothetical protein